MAALTFAIGARADWVAYNDHGVTGGYVAHVTTNNCRTASAGNLSLTNYSDGTLLSAYMTVANTGGTPANGGTMGNPVAGSPLYNVFNGIVNFSANGAQVTAAETVTITFSGLDPSKRYKFQGGSVRNGGYNDRWTKCDLLGVDSATANHQQGSTSPWGMITPVNEPSLMSGYQVAYNSGINTAGDMVEWDDIAPGSDGSFQVTSTQWQHTTAVNSHGTTAGTFTPSATTYGYAIDGFRLEEITVNTGPLTVNITPASQTVNQCGTATFTCNASGGTAPYTYQWYDAQTSVQLDGETGPTLTLNNVQASRSFVCLVIDAATTLQPSPEATLTVNAVTGVPAMLSAICSTNYQTITVTFNKNLSLSSATGGNFLVHPVDNSANVAITSSVVTNGTNVIIVTTDPLQQKNYRLIVQGSGVSGCAGSVADGTAIGIGLPVFIVSLTNSVWQYNEAAVDLGSAWLANNYDDQSAGWATSTAIFDGKTGSNRTMITTWPISSHLALTNAIYPTNDIPTYYFRHHFTNQYALSNIVALEVQTFFDDYGVVYLNGEEGYRDTQITAANYGFTNYNTTTVGDATLSAPHPFPITNLLASANVLSVYLKQGSAGSSDVTMGIQVIAFVTDLTTLGTGPRLTIVPGTGTVSVSWTPSGGTLQESTDLHTWTTSGTQANPGSHTATGHKFFRVVQ